MKMKKTWKLCQRRNLAKKILSTSCASISRICEADEDGKLDVLPCEQQKFLPLLVIAAFSQFVRVLDILMSMIEQEFPVTSAENGVTKEDVADHDKMFCQKCKKGSKVSKMSLV